MFDAAEIPSAAPTVFCGPERDHKDGEVSTLGVHRASFDEALATAADMIAMRGDETTITLEDTWEKRMMDETKSASLIAARSPGDTAAGSAPEQV